MARTKEFDEDLVLQKAVGLFISKGYNGASAQDLVDFLGISRSSLYDTFGDKRTLFLKAISKYRQDVGRSMIFMLENSEDLPATIKQILLHASQEALEATKATGCFMVNSAIEMAPHDPEVAQIVQENMTGVRDALSRAIARGQERGQIGSGHSPEALACFLFNAFSGIRVIARSGATAQDYEDIINVTLAALKV